MSSTRNLRLECRIALLLYPYLDCTTSISLLVSSCLLLRGGSRGARQTTHACFAPPSTNYLRRHPASAVMPSSPCACSARPSHHRRSRRCWPLHANATPRAPTRARALLTPPCGSTLLALAWNLPPARPNSRDQGFHPPVCAAPGLPGRGASSSLLLSNIFFQLLFGVVLWRTTLGVSISTGVDGIGTGGKSRRRQAVGRWPWSSIAGDACSVASVDIGKF